MLASGSKGELDEVAAEVKEVGGEVETIVRRPDSLEDAKAMLDAALKRFGRVDQLVVASGMNKPGFIHELDYEDWQAVMDANVRGIWFMAKAVGAHWIANKRARQGAADVVGARPPRQLFRLHRLLHVEGRDRLAHPRARDRMGEARHHRERDRADGVPLQAHRLDVRRRSELGQQTRARSLSRIPLGRLGEVEDLMGMAVYLLTPASDFCTGQIMYVDGGYTAG